MLPRGPARALPFLVAAAWLLAAAGPARSAGAWQTHLRVKDFTDLIVTQQEVWCATAEAGLLRFDRLTSRFESITREPGSIASNHLTCLAFDRVGRLWVGTFESGVSRLTADGSTWELVNAFDGLPVDSVTTITVAGDTLWIGTRGGIALWDGRQVLGSLPDGNTVSFDTTFVNPAITGVVQMRDTLWLSTPRGVGFARISTNLSDWRPASQGLATPAVDHLASDGLALYAQAGGLIYKWEPDSTRWISIGFIGIVHSMEEEYGTVLVSTDRGIYHHVAGGLFNLIPNSPTAEPEDEDDPEPAVDPTSPFKQFAGSRAGLWEQPDSAVTWTLYVPPGPPGNTYANIVVDGPRVYAATRNEGIGRWDGSTWFGWPHTVCPLPCPNTFRFPDEVFAMLVDTEGLKWVATWGYALDRFDDAADPDQFTHLWTGPGENVHTFSYGAAADSNGGRWFGMDSPGGVPLGLDFYDSTGAHAGTWGPGSPAGVSRVRGGKIRAITVDKTGRIWIGYAGAGVNSGVDHFVRRPIVGYDFRTVPNTSGLDIWAMVAHGDSIWVLTDIDLRLISRTTQSVTRIRAAPVGRAGDQPSRHMDVARDGSVWVGGGTGVRWYRQGLDPVDFNISNSPLVSNDVRAVAVEPATGAVWFGTAEGLNRYDPGYVPPAPPPGVEDTLVVFPSPATLTGLGIQLRLQGTAEGYAGGIYDLRGRLMHTFTTSSRGQVFWDGRDRDGVLVKPGVYFVRAEAAGRVARARFVLLH